MQVAYLYLPNQMADWEVGLIIAELNTGRFFKRKGERLVVKSFGLTDEPITTMGGQQITPALTIGEVVLDNAAVLILPGGADWQDPSHEPVLRLVGQFLQADKLVAAICGATEAMAQAGLLDHRSHTSNSLDYLKMAFPNYKGEAYYKQQSVVVDGSLITANNTEVVEFAYAILKYLQVFSDTTLDAWHKRFITHDPKYILDILKSLPQGKT